MIFWFIGGGISGLYIALEAASRGIQVALVEKQDFGNATSMATSKMIHGGLRYLKNYNFSIVRKSLKERSYLYRSAPHLLHPIKFMIPVYKHSFNYPFLLRLGMLLYDIFSYDKNLPLKKQKKYLNLLKNSKTINKKSALEMESILQERGFRKAFLYDDVANLHTERYNISVAHTAEKIWS